MLVEDGELIEPHLRREGLERQELEMVREHGVEALSGVKLAVLETEWLDQHRADGREVVRTAKHIRQTRKR